MNFFSPETREKNEIVSQHNKRQELFRVQSHLVSECARQLFISCYTCAANRIDCPPTLRKRRLENVITSAESEFCRFSAKTIGKLLRSPSRWKSELSVNAIMLTSPFACDLLKRNMPLIGPRKWAPFRREDPFFHKLYPELLGFQGRFPC